MLYDFIVQIIPTGEIDRITGTNLNDACELIHINPLDTVVLHTEVREYQI